MTDELGTLLRRDMAEFLDGVHRCLRAVNDRGGRVNAFDVKSPEGGGALVACLLVAGLRQTQGSEPDRVAELETATELIRQLLERARR